MLIASQEIFEGWYRDERIGKWAYAVVWSVTDWKDSSLATSSTSTLDDISMRYESGDAIDVDRWMMLDD